MKAYIAIVILLIIGIVIVYWNIIKFHQYDYRESERTGLRDRPDSKPKDKDEWVNDYTYDPETKRFIHKTQNRK